MGLILLRHAPPEVQYHGCYNGHTDIPIDTALFDPSKILSLQNQQFDRIYSSDLQRCTKTLEMIGLTAFTCDPRLREVCFKPSIEGKTFEQIEAIEHFDPRSLDCSDSWHHYVCDEPLTVFQARVQSFLDELPKNEHILICSHGGTIAMILTLLNPEIPNKSLGYLDHITTSLG